MAENIREIATKLGATIVGQVPDAGGGAFGAARLANDVARLRAEVRPVRITPVTLEQLERIAARASTPERRVDALDVAARILEEAVAAELSHPRG
jgi:hypothetical protein